MATCLVTGASSGIGEAFARLLAERGHDLVVTARRNELLDRLARELHERFDGRVEPIAADLRDPRQLAVVEDRLHEHNHPVEMLVNNAGAGIAGEFAATDVEAHVDQISLNITALVRLTHAAVDSMTPRRSGAILNVASIGGLAPAPRFATYGASKAFVVSFTHSLHEELRARNIHVTCLCPGATRSEFGLRSGATGDGLPAFAWMTAAAVAHSGLAALDNNTALCTPDR